MEVLNMKECPKAKRAFTLVELLVVIGIISVLMGIMLGTVLSGTDSARAAKCLSNMRNLAQAAIATANRDTNYSHYPAAGSYATIEIDNSTGKPYCQENRGWISWLSTSDPYHTRTTGDKPASFVKVNEASAFEQDEEKALFAITNGTLWKAMGGNLDSYRCPSHAILAKKHGVNLRWSYVMNAYFGYDQSEGSDVCAPSRCSPSGLVRKDRVLLFAELPFAISGACDSANKVDEGTAYATGENNAMLDCTLQYKASYNGRNYNNDYGGTAEAIAFNHKSGKSYCAHVAFADGHVEKLILPKDGSGLTSVQLTALLCEGVDVAYDGKGYSLITDGDKN